MPKLASRIQQNPRMRGFTPSPASVRTTSWQKTGSKQPDKSQQETRSLNPEDRVLAGERMETSGGNGEWTKWMQYDGELQALTITFQDGFVKQYVHVTPEMAIAAYRGVQTSSMNPQRNDSTGAWLHQNLIGQFRP